LQPTDEKADATRLPAPGAAGAIVPEEPRLIGFAFSEDRSGRRDLATIHLGAETWVVAEGDLIGSYRVDTIVAGEEVVLRDTVTGRQTLLRLEP